MPKSEHDAVRVTQKISECVTVKVTQSESESCRNVMFPLSRVHLYIACTQQRIFLEKENDKSCI